MVNWFERKGKSSAPDPPEPVKRASVTAFRRFFRINSWAVFRASKLDPDGVDADYPADLDDAALGEAVHQALNASRFIGPDHPDWNRVSAYGKSVDDRQLLDRFFSPAGVKSHHPLNNGVGHVSLELRANTIALEPSRYEGRGGFGPIRGVKPIELPETVSDEVLGATIRHLIDVSRRPWRY